MGFVSLTMGSQGFSARLLQNGLPRLDAFGEVLGPGQPGRNTEAMVEMED